MSKTYAFPRRFDLKMLLGNFTAWSILLAMLGAFKIPTTAIFFISTYLVAVAAAQFLFASWDHPRFVSILTGISLCLLFSFFGRLLDAPGTPLPILLVIAQGTLMGYLAGLSIGAVSMITEFVTSLLSRLFGDRGKTTSEENRFPECQGDDR